MNMVQQSPAPVLLFQLTHHGRSLRKSFQLRDLLLPFDKWKQSLWMTWAPRGGLKRSLWTWVSHRRWWREQGMSLFSTEGCFWCCGLRCLNLAIEALISHIAERGDVKIVSSFWKIKPKSQLFLKCWYDFRAEVMLFLLRVAGSSISEVCCHQKNPVLP